jgi:catechol 2,3-dioxygenase-like lactoylglutathione lyase family enzyme
MAYRFLLEVPETLAAEAGMAVGEAGDAEVVVVRDSYRTDFDTPYLDLTIAAQSLRVVDNIYQWLDSVGIEGPDVRLVLHSGEKLPLAERDKGSVIGAIRRDQPWVERSIPKIGDHEPEDPTSADKRHAAVADFGARAPAVETEREVVIRQLNHIALQVTDLPKAEAFYTSLFSMDLVGRARRSASGEIELLDDGAEPTISFLRNGPLTIALEGAGRGARMERSILSHISIRVDAVTFTNLKGQALMRSYEMLMSTQTAFAFRDPFSVTWEITLYGAPQSF